MKTEEYIIILVGVVAGHDQIRITYTSNAPVTHTSIRVVYSNGMTVKTFDNLRNAAGAVLEMSTAGLMPGSYTCEIAFDGNVKDSKKFSLS